MHCQRAAKHPRDTALGASPLHPIAPALTLNKPASSGGRYAGARWFIVPPALLPTTALPLNLDTVQERVKDATACRSPSLLAIC